LCGGWWRSWVRGYNESETDGQHENECGEGEEMHLLFTPGLTIILSQDERQMIWEAGSKLGICTKQRIRNVRTCRRCEREVLYLQD